MLNENSLEFLTDFAIFEKQSLVRRPSDLNTKVAFSGAKMLLPKNPMMHILDNFGHSDQATDTFDLNEYPFLNGKNNIKYIHHFVDFDRINKEDLDKFNHRMYRSKLYENLRNYGISNRRILIPVQHLDTVIANKNCIIVENYNPLFRILNLNNRPINHYFRYRAFMSTVLNNTTRYDRQHFIVIPVPATFSYIRTNLMSLVQNEEIAPQKLISNSHFYFFIIDLVALLLDNNSKLSTFNTISHKQLSMINIMLIHKDKSIIFNMGKIATLASSKTYVFNFLDHICRLSNAQVPVPEAIDNEEIPSDINDGQADDVNQDQAVTTSKTVKGFIQTNNTQLSRAFKPVVPTDIDINDVIEVDAKDHETSIKDNVSASHEIEDKSQVGSKVEPKLIVPKSEIKHNHLIPKVIIDEVVTVSDKQQTRIEALANKYKEIKVKTPTGEKTVEEIISEEIDISLTPEEIRVENIDGIDPNMLKTVVKKFDQEYRDKVLRKDILVNIVAFSENGLFLTDYVETNEYNNFNRVKHVKATFTDIRGKKHTVNFKLPMPDDEGYYLVNGVRLSMSKQLVNIPICKISPTRVSLISNYNKTLVDKIQSPRFSLAEYLGKKAQDLNLKIVPKHNVYIGIKVPSDYKQLGNLYGKITSDTHTFFFEYHERFINCNTDTRAKVTVEGIKLIEDQYGVIVGYSNKEPINCVFMTHNNLCTTVNIKTGNIIEKDVPIVKYLNDVKVPAEWCDLKILDKNIPIIFILGYRYGLSKVLNNMNIKYRFVKQGSKNSVINSNTEIAIKFSDGYLVFDRYPLLHSYILSGLAAFSTLKHYNSIDLDGRDVYYNLISDKGMSPNYLRGIDNYFSFFIDPITKEVLTEMGEPTNTRDLLIRAVEMLIDSTDKEPSAISNFRVRSAEKIPAMIYNEISRQYANYINSNFKDVSFSINTEAIYQRIIQDETMNLREDLNPIHAIKENNRVTYTGFGGRSSEAFVARDRKYPKDAIGVLSELTTDSGSVGMVATMTSNPNIKNLRGMFDEEAINNETNVMSDIGLLMPNSTHDDPKRANYTSIQLSHHIPTPNLKPMRLRTGYEMVVPHKTSSIFIGKAKKNGVVTNIDYSLNLITIKYEDNTVDVFEFGDIRGEGSGKAINHKIEVMLGLKVDSKVKTNQVITYHKEFFQLDPITNQLSWCHGVPITMAIMPKDVTLEDSSLISAELANKMGFDSIYDRPIQITTDMVVESFADVGTKVSYNDPLIQLKYEETADVIGDVDELFAELKQVSYRSKHEGVIVGIEVYCVTESLNQSLTKFVNKVTNRNRKRAKLVKGTRKEAEYTPVMIVPEGTRIKGVQLGSTDVLVIFYIKSNIACGIGDKVVFGNMLKSVVGRIEDKPMITENGETIDVIFGAISIFDRIVLSVFINGICDRILQKEEQNIIDMYFDEN